MRYLAFVSLLLPSLVLGQQLHTFRNGEVADAEQVNYNFQSISNDLSELKHPEGDLSFRRSDTFRFVLPKGLLSQSTTEVMTLKIGETLWGDLTEHKETYPYTQQGITFTARHVRRNYPGRSGTNDYCPEGTNIYLPFEFHLALYNDLGGITFGTAWDFGEEGPTPDNTANNPSGSYICLIPQDDGTNKIIVSMLEKTSGGVGRYRCAKWVGDRYEATLPLSVAQEVTLDAATLPGQTATSMTLTFQENDPLKSGAYLNMDVPATCE